MPKVDIDYSNTIFYKIFCKDTNIKDLYVGLTTNFVQRKHAHKQGCNNIKNANYNCKLYTTIRNSGGWDNWKMEIIAFHNCADSYEAHKKEQEYFETLGATLNSIEPLPKPKFKDPVNKIIKEKPVLFCQSCNIYLTSRKTQDAHNKTNKHHKSLSINKTEISMTLQNKYACLSCDYYTCNKKDYTKHLSTTKHLKMTNDDHVNDKSPLLFVCKCGNKYKYRQGLFRHKQNCIELFTSNDNSVQPSAGIGGLGGGAAAAAANTDILAMQTTLILELVKQNKEFKDLLIQQSNQLFEQNKSMMDVAKNCGGGEI